MQKQNILEKKINQNLVDENAGLKIETHLKIVDLNSNQVLVNKRA